MGRSEPPFLYDRPSTYNFHGPTDPGFNPKAVTQASRIREQPKPKPTGPLLNFNRHPDSWAGSLDKSTWTPMHPNTKNRVKYTRGAQLGLRVVTLVGALGSLFCSIVIKNAATTVIWIIRAGPIVAIMHTIYGICHLSRSPAPRPPASQASYGVFASTLDLGLIPFYVFTAIIAHAEYTEDAYHWGTMFKSTELTVDISEAMFICALANAGLHLVSLSLSIYLAVIFRKISNLPPDLNPLEDNLTARPQRSRKEINIDEKHMSSSTLASTMEDPLIGPPRSVPFIHTRGHSFGGESSRGSVDIMNEKRQSQASFQQHRLSHMEPASPEMLFHQPQSQPFDLTSQISAPEYRNVPKQLPEFVDPSTHMRHLASRTADRSDSVSPLSDNWIAYSDRAPSPVNDGHNPTSTTLRQSSSVYSRRTDATGASTGSGIRDWFAYGQKPANVGSAIPEDTRGEYASVAVNEYYGYDDDNDHEQDLGDTRFNIFPDPEEHENDIQDGPAHELPFNPLMLNPPTPQPVLTEIPENADPVRRNALDDNPNLSHNLKAHGLMPQATTNSPPTKSRFYGDLEGDGKLGRVRSREPSGQDQMARKPTKLSKKRSKKMAAYQTLKKDDSGDEGHLSSPIPASPALNEGDRKGRVVSNTGADTFGQTLGGAGASLSSYGSYLAGLGVPKVGTRRRDVSGKVAEEGRGGKSIEVDSRTSPNPSQSQTRAAGWTRFAGL
ncbi:uncharacterized protein N7477_008926 [Penicillium maclennaniae]|uniref:uncharacterized protein n=1 Tax=Penicillium maclennaniae TaxID=1343394 RepID=UPI00254208D2|nr:uncharacterized protein N7477_008926 [Penicillium maclennaniae]KAJ5666478.1 hypothetical protein N7477_008926 [Penicillium maclennaniae]